MVNLDLKALADDALQRASAIGLSPDDLCSQAKISRATYQRWKSGKTRADPELLGSVIAVIEAAEAKAA